MKRNRIYIIIAALLALLALILIISRSKSTFSKSISDFAVDDTSTVTRIFMADKNNNVLTLSRTDQGLWVVNDKYPAQKFNIDMLLSTILEIQVKEPVPTAARNNIIRQLAVSSVKVEIYQKRYRINIFNRLRLFPHEKLSKVYYVGGATQSNRGTYMLMERSSDPFITFLPGLRGFLSPRFMPFEKYWRDYSVFKKNFREIRSVRMEFPTRPDQSYAVTYNAGETLKLVSLADNREIQGFDTIRVMSFLAAFAKIDFEAILNDLDQHKKDSILSSTPFAIISLTDTAGTGSAVKIFHRAAYPGEVDEYGNPIPYDLDRAFALVNNGQDFVLIQYLVFDKILRPKLYFLKTGVKTP